jgi:hypothetical protein
MQAAKDRAAEESSSEEDSSDAEEPAANGKATKVSPSSLFLPTHTQIAHAPIYVYWILRRSRSQMRHIIANITDVHGIPVPKCGASFWLCSETRFHIRLVTSCRFLQAVEEVKTPAAKQKKRKADEVSILCNFFTDHVGISTTVCLSSLLSCWYLLAIAYQNQLSCELPSVSPDR